MEDCFSVKEVMAFQCHIGHKRILSLSWRLLNSFLSYIEVLAMNTILTLLF